MTTPLTEASTTGDSHDVVAIPLRHPWRWVAAVVVVALVACLIVSVVRNDNIDHPTVSKFLFNGRILSGLGLTLLLTALSMVISTVLATLVAVMRLSANPVLAAVAWVYVWVFRGIPLLVQIVFWGFLALLWDHLQIGVPFTDWDLFSVKTNTLVTPFVAGLLALTLNQVAYSAEIIRAGIVSVDSGQREAAYSLGMTGPKTFRKIVLPQAMRVIIPPMGNETISMLKNTSLLELISVKELYTVSSQIAAANFRQVELLVVISFWYLLVVSVLSIPQHYLEKRFGKGVSR